MIYLEIEMPLKEFNLNQHTQKARSGWQVSASHKKKTQEVIKYQLLDQKVRPIKTPCSVVAIWHTKARNFDLDNMLLKAVLDQLQAMDLLENDNVNHIKEITHKFELNKEWQGLKIYFIEGVK